MLPTAAFLTGYLKRLCLVVKRHLTYTGRIGIVQIRTCRRENKIDDICLAYDLFRFL